jgi:transposase
MSSLQVYNSRGIKYVRIVESYRDPVNKKPKTRVLKVLGRADELEAQEPGILNRLRRECRESRAFNESLKQEAIFKDIQHYLEGSDNDAAKGFPIRNYGVKVYESIWDELKLDYFFDYRQKRDSNLKFKVKDTTSMLVYFRLLKPASKKKSFEQKEFFINSKEMNLEQIYRSLSFLANEKKSLERHLNKQLSLKMTRNLGVAFYDVTTYYFESVRADELKKFGYSKDNKVNQVQVVMGLLIDDEGIPISYELFPGNTNDFKTLVPVMEYLRETYGIKKIIITADRGLNSKQNLAYLRSKGFDYVMAYKIRSASKAIKNLVLGDEGYTVESPQFKWKVCNFQNSVKINGEKVLLDDNMVITWSAKRAEKDRRDRERLIEKSRRLVDSKSSLKAEMKKGGKKYVQLAIFDDDHVSFNENQVEMDAQFDGYYGIQSSDKSLSAAQVIGIYQGLWKIEESFRVMKSNLEARPIFVWTESSIRGHFVMCYLALVIQRYLEYKLRKEKLELSTEKIQDALRSANLTVIDDAKSNSSYYLKNQSNEDFSAILSTLQLPEILPYGKLKDIRKA